MRKEWDFLINGNFRRWKCGNVYNFNQIQFEGFCRFIDQGLTEELSKFPKIEDTDQEMEFQLFVERGRTLDKRKRCCI
jgi:hypothetical protein